MLAVWKRHDPRMWQRHLQQCDGARPFVQEPLQLRQAHRAARMPAKCRRRRRRLATSALRRARPLLSLRLLAAGTMRGRDSRWAIATAAAAAAAVGLATVCGLLVKGRLPHRRRQQKGRRRVRGGRAAAGGGRAVQRVVPPLQQRTGQTSSISFSRKSTRHHLGWQCMQTTRRGGLTHLWRGNGGVGSRSVKLRQPNL